MKSSISEPAAENESSEAEETRKKKARKQIEPVNPPILSMKN